MRHYNHSCVNLKLLSLFSSGFQALYVVCVCLFRIGSDEDDESATDESQSIEDPSETAVSINARRSDRAETEEESERRDGSAPDAGAGSSPSEEARASSAGTTGTQASQQASGADQGRDADQGASSGKLNGTMDDAADYVNGDVCNCIV